MRCGVVNSTSHARNAGAAEATAEEFAIDRCADLALDLYGQCLERDIQQRRMGETSWERAMRLINAEWELLKGMAGATGAALGIEDTPDR